MEKDTNAKSDTISYCGRQNAVSLLDTLIGHKERELEELREFQGWFQRNCPAGGVVEEWLYRAVAGLERR